MPLATMTPDVIVDDQSTDDKIVPCEMWRLGVVDYTLATSYTNPKCPNPAKLVVIIHHCSRVPSCPDCYAAFRRLVKKIDPNDMACRVCHQPVTWADIRSERL